MSRANPTKPNEANFIFLNNDNLSASRKKSLVDFSVRSHIMTEFKRKEKLAGLVWLKKNSSSVDNFLRPRKDANVPDNPSDPRAHDPSRGSRVPIRQRRIQEGNSTSGQIKPHMQDAHQFAPVPRYSETSGSRHPAGARQPLPATILLNGGADDPFSSTSTRLDPWMHGLIHYFVNVCMPTLFAVQTDEHQYFQSTSGVLEDVVSALSDSSHMNAILAMSAAHMEVRKGSPLVETDLRVKGSLFFKGRAVNLLQQRLAKNVNDVDFFMMQAIMKLSAAESILGNYQAQLVHIRAWCHIVTILGGIQKFDWRIIESDMTTGMKHSVPFVGKPILDADWSPFQLPDERKPTVTPLATSPLRALGCRLLEKEGSDLFQPEFVYLLQDIRPLVFMSEFCSTRPEDAIPADFHWLRISALAIAHRLCTFPLSYPKLKPYPKCSIQWSVRVSMLLYADATLINQVPRTALVPELKQALGTSPLHTFWAPLNTVVLLWVLCMGLHGAEGMVEEPWFVDQVARTAGFLGAVGWHEVAPVLREFFYLDRVHGIKLERLWKKVELRSGQLSE